MFRRLTVLFLCNGVLFASAFQNGQAARAVLGQSSFTSRDAGIRVTSISVSAGQLYAADASHRVLTFDLYQLPDAHQDFAAKRSNGCGVCGFSPVAVATQAVAPGVARYSQWGKSVAMVDPVRHRVRFWRDARNAQASIVLGQPGEAGIGPTTLIDPVSVAIDGARMFVGDAALHRVLVWNSLPTVNDQPADAVLGQPELSLSTAPESPMPGSIDLPAALASDGVNLFVADTKARRILVFSPGDKLIKQNSVVNSASFASGPFAPGTLISVNGTGLSGQTKSVDADQSHALPTQLAGTEAVFDGQALPLISVSPNKAEAQLPFDFGNRSAASFYVRVQHEDGSVTNSAPVTLKLAAASPGLFAFGGSEPRGGILLHATNAQTGAGLPVTKQNPVRRGEIVTILATGLGAVLDNSSSESLEAGVPVSGNAAPVAIPVTAEINGQVADVISARLLPEGIGVYQIAIVIPDGLAGAGGHLQVAQNGYTSNTVTFAIR